MKTLFTTLMNLPSERRMKKIRRKNNPRRKNKMKNQGKLPMVVPNEWFCYMKYISTNIGFVPTGIFGVFDYYINSVNQPDVGGTDTTNPIGYNELNQIYINSLVLSCTTEIEFSNREDFEIGIFMGCSTQRLVPSITTAGEVEQLGELPYGKSLMVGKADGMSTGKLTINCNCSKLVGNRKMYFGDLTWIAGASARPTNKLYITVGFTCPPTKTFTNGIGFRLKQIFKVKWSNRAFDDITLSLSQKESNEKIDRGRLINTNERINEIENESDDNDDEIHKLKDQVKKLSEIIRKLTNENENK